MSNKETVVVIYNETEATAAPDDLDTVVQANLVADSLERLGYQPLKLPVTLDIKTSAENLRKLAPVFVFNLVESLAGEGYLSHLAPLLLEHLKIKYCGCPAEAIYLTTNKLLAKKMLQLYGVNTPKWVSISEDSGFSPNQEYIIKPVSEDASIGLDGDFLARAANLDNLRKLLLKKQDLYGKEFFAEAYIDGREFNLSILGGGEAPLILPPAEIKFIGYEERNKAKVVDYKAKWFEDTFEYRNTVRTFEFPSEDQKLLGELKVITRSCWDCFRLRGYARVDFRVDRNNNPWVLEVNANPCLTPGSGLMAAAEQAGLDFTEVIRRIVADV